MESIGYRNNTIIALKCLSILHKYILYGPARGEIYEMSEKEIEAIHEAWAANIML